jgi:hypothetical protein
MPSLNGLTYEQVVAVLDREFAEARIQAEGRAQAEQERAERRRQQLVLRGEARAARGRIYDMIQTGHYRQPV